MAEDESTTTAYETGLNKQVIERVTEMAEIEPQQLLERLIEDAQKIHQQRPILQETLATATQPRCES